MSVSSEDSSIIRLSELARVPFGVYICQVVCKCDADAMNGGST